MNSSHVQNWREPITLEGGADLIRTLVDASRRLRPSEKGHWGGRLDHCYGDLRGQRALDIDGIHARLNQRQGTLSCHELVIAMEAYFSLVCLLLAAAALRPRPEQYLDSLGKRSSTSFRNSLARIIDGSEFEQFAIYGLREAVDLNWVAASLSDVELAKLQLTTRQLSSYWKYEIAPGNSDDVTQPIHSALFPKNLMHSMGQFFSPAWLVDRLLADVEWTGNGLFIDPFCGSGVFLLRALRNGVERGLDLSELLKRCVGIDMSPVATVAAQCNLIIMISRFRKDSTKPVSINILNADSLAPAVIKGRNDGAPLLLIEQTVRVGGETISLPDCMDDHQQQIILEQLAGYGLDLRYWIKGHTNGVSTKRNTPDAISTRDRKILEQLAVFCLTKADVLGTNPPWVGWEYMSRSYRGEVQPAWDTYGLFNSKGLQASFLKEDLSTVATIATWDLYLREGGRSVVIIKPSTMKADLTGRGIRRLSIYPDSQPVCLELVREFDNLEVFQDAKADACSWQIAKGRQTSFPVSVKTWVPFAKRLKPQMSASLNDVEAAIRELPRSLDRTTTDDAGSRWLITDQTSLDAFACLRGSNPLVPRMGVFTGGANAIFYVERLSSSDGQGVSKWRNVTERAKRFAPEVEMLLEDSLVRPVLRGRDIQPWQPSPAAQLLFPHSSETRMVPLGRDALLKDYPLALTYLSANKEILESRKGFAGWEKKIHEQYFYSLQRIGEYTFQPYKVCWKYIASEFVVCVLGSDEGELEVIPNDKVMFIGFADKNEAFYYGGVLSGRSVRSFINSSISKRQISANAIQGLRIPPFEESNRLHQRISSLCLSGHRDLKRGDTTAANKVRVELDQLVAEIYSTLQTSAAA